MTSKALMGAEAVRELLSSIHVTEEAERLRGELRHHFVRSKNQEDFEAPQSA